MGREETGMNTQRLLWQLDAMRRSIATVQSLQCRAYQTQALLRTIGDTANLCTLVEAIHCTGNPRGPMFYRQCRRKI